MAKVIPGGLLNTAGGAELPQLIKEVGESGKTAEALTADIFDKLFEMMDAGGYI